MSSQYICLLCLVLLNIHESLQTNGTSRQFWRPGGLPGLPNMFNSIRLQNTPCNTETGDAGTCLSDGDCKGRLGTSSGACGRSGLVCCTFKFTCSGKTSSNETLFVNPSYPLGENGTNTCQVTIQNVPDVCQLRLGVSLMSLCLSTL